MPWGGILMSSAQMKNVLNRLARIKGHVEGIYEMVEADRSCPDVIVQIVAVRSALNKVAQIILKDHAEHYLVEAAQSGNFESELESFYSALDMLL